MKRDFKLYLSDIVENMDAAERFIGSMTYDDFLEDDKTSYAVVRCWEIIGEAVKNISAEIRSRRPDVPWKDLAGMRDKCIHMYFNVNFSRVWESVKKDIPQIRPAIQSLLEELRREQPKPS
jgi:uncharacterized protein with HEPN domain